ncbi:FAD-dependent oxidoreductase [Prosthecobacter sp.]|uniref:FAD-dependent oxidoreductase n=1 Tax=Prosthecobacter sp. TaxID=1965333 RepID=UPI002AB86E41|nr:FAD-dependent oxidoreductase [Prosthecobacter sp.]MDZ4402113.1 FAD-dependent oxidoreductase [Prosthecobacter sp.]
MKLVILVLTTSLLGISLQAAESTTLETDLLIVGGNESGCAAAVQAARLGVKKIVLVNDIDWLGGQFSAEGVGCPDEWTTVNGRRVNFPRSGIYSEVINRVRAHNSQTYGLPTPGNAYCGTETIEPAAAAKIFEELVKPYVDAGVLRIERGWQAAEVRVEQNRVTEVGFVRSSGFSPSKSPLTVRAKFTLDSSDWGDVIRLSGAKYGAGADLKSRFGEVSAPATYDDADPQEMNPLSWCVVLREAGKNSTIPRPAIYDPRSFAQLDKTPPWVDSDMSAGTYSQSGWSVYTHRRLVDRWHNDLAAGTEATFLNWPVQDYPLCQLPQRVVDALEKTAPGASKKNIVHLTPAQRQIIFDDAKQHALSMLYHLQTAVHDRVGDFPQTFRYMKLTTEFGTPDLLPPKPYVREGLRLEALYMLREQDIRAETREPKWAKVLVPDGVFGFQFNIDFHPTRRRFIGEDRNGPWLYVQTPSRGWHTDTDRAMFPLRGLVPVQINGLLGCSKNIGVSSVVQSALRLHGQMMHVGQASATLAWICLRDGLQPRTAAASQKHWREIQLRLVRGNGGPGVLLWPWQDLPTDALHFEAANMLAVRGIWPADADSVSFGADQIMTRRELVRVLARLVRAQANTPQWPMPGVPRFTDVGQDDTDRTAIESLCSWGIVTTDKTFNPDHKADWGTLYRWSLALKLPADRGLLAKEVAQRPLTRADAAIQLWKVLRTRGEWLNEDDSWLQPDNDHDEDERKDFDDPLPFDSNNNNVPDRLEYLP